MIFWYSRDGSVFHDRLEAYKSPKPCYLYYYDKEFIAADWKTEPKESLPELYKQQAQRIRDEYDYVVLAYSGGVDSTNMLEAFYYNNIHIDEILMVGAFGEDSFKGSDENHNGEIYRNCFPTLEKMNLSNTKINIQDYSKIFNDPKKLLVVREYQTDWFLGLKASFFSPHIWFWNEVHQHTFHKGKKAALVFGVDKPNTHVRDKTCVFEFFDSNIMSYCGFNSRDGLERVNFYWDPKEPRISIKQAHVINNFRKIPTNRDTQHLIGMNRARFEERLIYNLKNPLLFVSKKATNNILSPRDAYMANKKDSEMFDIYKKGIFALNKVVPFGRDMVSFRSRGYVIDDNI